MGRGTMRGWVRRADVEKEKAANGSLRVDLMRNRGERSWGGETRKGGVIYEEESTATRGIERGKS